MRDGADALDVGWEPEWMPRISFAFQEDLQVNSTAFRAFRPGDEDADMLSTFVEIPLKLQPDHVYYVSWPHSASRGSSASRSSRTLCRPSRRRTRRRS